MASGAKKCHIVTSNFSFSHNIFNSSISLVHQNVALCGNGLNCFCPSACRGINSHSFTSSSNSLFRITLNVGNHDMSQQIYCINCKFFVAIINDLLFSTDRATELGMIQQGILARYIGMISVLTLSQTSPGFYVSVAQVF